MMRGERFKNPETPGTMITNLRQDPRTFKNLMHDIKNYDIL